MNNMLLQKFQTNIQYVKKNSSMRFCKMLYLCCFFIGFAIFLLLGKELLGKIALLDIDSLKGIKDCDLKKESFFLYVLWRRILIFGIGIFFWWWSFGKLFLYGTIGISAVSMGICMYTCLMRYRLKGLFLWFFLYFPHVIFYAAAIACGIILSSETFRVKEEGIRFLWKNGFWLLVIFAVFLVGIYTESYVNTVLLQDYLEFF